MNNMTYNELKKVIDAFKQKALGDFYADFKGYDTSKFRNVWIKAYDNASEEFYIYASKLPKDSMTIEEIVSYVWRLQEDKGGSWQFEAELDEDNYVWFGIGETLFDYDWYLEEGKHD